VDERKAGGALDFDESTDHIGVGGFNESVSEATFTAWIKIRSREAYDGIVHSRSTDTTGLNVDDSGERVGYHWNNSKYGWSGGPKIPLNRWVFVAISVSSSEAKAYLGDAGEIKSGTNSTSHSETTIDDLLIGNDDCCGQRLLDGQIDNVRIYDRALSASEVKDLYNSGGQATRHQVSRSGLLGHWSMNDAGGLQAEDYSSNDNTGDVNGGLTWTDGIRGVALDLDGRNDYVQADSPTVPTDDFTYSAWLNLDDTSDETYFMHSAGSGGNELAMRVNSGNVDVFTNGSRRVTSAQTVPANEWTHVTVTRNSGTIKIHVNGNEDSNTGSDSGSLSIRSCPLIIGADVDSGCSGDLGNWTDGTVDDMRVYDYAMSARDVQSLYQAGETTVNRALHEKLSDDMVAMLSFDGTTVQDGVANDMSSATGQFRVVGEAETFSSKADGGWSTINFRETYTSPVVVGSNNSSDSENAVIVEANNVSSNSADVRACKIKSDMSGGCATLAAGETVGYMVIEEEKLDNFRGIAAGTYSIDGEMDTTSNTHTFSNRFESEPSVFSAVQTSNGTSPVEARVTSVSTSSFTGGLCQPQSSSDNSCDSGHTTETVGWIAIDPGAVSFDDQTESGEERIGDSNWAAMSFTPDFLSDPVMIGDQQTENGGQDNEVVEFKSVSTSSAEVRYCEFDSGDSCDSHNGEEVAWYAFQAGRISVSEASGDKNPGTLQNGPKPTIGASGQGLSFDGSDDFVCLDDTGNCDGNDSNATFDNSFDTRTVSLWYKTPNLSGTQVLFEEGGTTNGLNVYLSGNSLYAGAWAESNGWDGSWHSTNTTVNEWHHAALRFDGNGTTDLYHDGVSVGSVSSGSTMASHGGEDSLGGSADSSTKLHTGDSRSASYYEGVIDNVRVYNDALSENKIEHLYKLGP